MKAKIPEKNKKPGICYAVTDRGVELPVIDITHPAFAENASPEKVRALADDYLDFQRSPGIFQRFFISHSLVMRGLEAASGSFLAGMSTYVAKLGPEILGKGYAGLIDRKVAGGVGSVSFRIRLREMSCLMAEALIPQLSAQKAGCIQMFNIGGGPAMDSLNALILIQKKQPGLLAGRQIILRILDPDPSGPSFGARALAALSEEGAPLHGLEISSDAVSYDWTQAAALEEIIDRFGRNDIMIGSSEGGLFEYGSDETITANLHALRAHTPQSFAMVGSFLQESEIARRLQASSKMSVRTFTAEAFESLAAGCGWRVEQSVNGNPLYQMVCLKKT